MNTLDKVDKKIIQLLLEDSAMSYQKIADIVFLSRSAVDKRIDNLKKSGVIKRFTIELATEELDHYTLLLIKSFGGYCDLIFEQLKPIKKDFTFVLLYGEFDSLIKIKTTNLNQLYKIKRRLTSLPEVESVTILPILETRYHQQ